MTRFRSTLATASALALGLAAAVSFIAPATVRAVSGTVVISEFRTRGPAGASDEFVEIYNLSAAPVDISGWKIRGSNSTASTSERLAIGAGVVLGPGCHFLAVNAATSGYSGLVPGDQTYATGITDTGGVALTSADDVIVDQVGLNTGSAYKEGTVLAPLTTNTDQSYERKPGGAAGSGQDTDDNASDFALLTPSAPQNLASPCITPGVPTPPTGVGGAAPATVFAGGATLLTVAVMPGTIPPSTGIAVTADLTAIGGLAAQALIDDGANGDLAAGDLVFSRIVTVAPGTAPGAFSLPVTIGDAQSRSSAASIGLTVSALNPGDIVISEFRTRGPLGGNDEFVELYNRSSSTIDLSGLKIMGSNAAGTSKSARVTIAAGTLLAPGCHFLATNSATSNGPYSGAIAGDETYGTGIADDGGIALARSDGTTLLDQVGMGATSAYQEGGTLTPLTTNAEQSYERLPGGALGSGTDTNDNASDFVYRTTSDPQNLASACSNPNAPTNPSGVGSAVPSSVAPGGTTLVAVAAVPGANPASTGLGVTADLAPIGGGAADALFDDGTNGDALAGDLIFSRTVTVAPGTPAGALSIQAHVTDAQARAGTVPIPLTVVPPPPPDRPIHDLQGGGATSPFAGQLVATTGIVTATTGNGFFIQTPDAEVDADPATSEGVFVFTSSTLPAAAVVGNDVRVVGTVSEYIPSADPASPPVTEISNFPVVTALSTGNPLPSAAAVTAADTGPAGTLDDLERLEGMRVHVASLTVVAPTQGYVDEPSATSTSSGVFYTVVTGVARPMREAGIDRLDPVPPTSACCVTRFDGNPERLRIDSDAQRGASLLDVASGQTLADVTGIMDVAYRTWTILPDPSPALVAAGPAAATPVPDPRPGQFTVASFNMERFFDTTNDPATSDAVLTTDAFERRLSKASLAIRTVMKLPDILGVEEMEHLSTLQAVAARVNADAVAAGAADPAYEAYLVEGNDIGGIDVGLLVKTSRVTVVDVTQVGLDATYLDPVSNAPALLNDRPPLVLRAVIPSPAGHPFPLTVLVNHLRSLSGIDDPSDGPRVRAKRLAQAEFLANLIQARQWADPTEAIVSVGDYNAFQVSDGYVDVIGSITGAPADANSVVLAGPDLVDPDLTDLVNLLPADQRYSYSFDGNGQVLDHVIVNGPALARYAGFAYARADADFPETFRNDATRPERLSDHDMPVAYFTFPQADLRVAVADTPDPVLNGAPLAYAVTVTNDGPDAAASLTFSQTLSAGLTFGSVAAPAGWTCSTPAPGATGTVSCTAPGLAAGDAATLTLVAGVDGNLANGTTVTTSATVASATDDPDGADDTASATTTISNPPPVISNASANPSVLWPPNHQLVPVTVLYTVTDQCGEGTQCVLTVSEGAERGEGGPASDRARRGAGVPADSREDWVVIDATHVRLRAERSLFGPGRVYTITITCTDSAGGQSSTPVQVRVPHSRGWWWDFSGHGPKGPVHENDRGLTSKAGHRRR